MRSRAPAKLFVKTDDGLRCFLLEDRGDHWFCRTDFEQGRNIRLQTSELRSAKQAMIEARGVEPGAEEVE